MVKSKLEDLAKMLGHSNFKATDGWLVVSMDMQVFDILVIHEGIQQGQC
jgi:hypothetical protein